jgi:hypothetical protein
MPRGSAPGERRGGRAKGTPNKVTDEIRTVARQYGPAVIERLAMMAGVVPDCPGADNAAVQVAAMRELLDRGFGRATQHVAGADDAPPVSVEFLWAPAMPQQPEAASHSEATTITAVADDDDDGNVVPLVTWGGSSR